MPHTFYKYQGTGNDFVIIDNRLETVPKNDTKLISKLCDRRFGIGADGVILLENHTVSDFKMVYFNSNGAEGTMCGNGGRCIVHFANFLGIIDNSTTFEAVDGKHEAFINNEKISLKMQDVQEIEISKEFAFLNTGSPHHVQFTENVDAVNVFEHGKALRYTKYGNEGANINFVSKLENGNFKVRTYERGVENETLSCGTGVTAVALALHKTKKIKTNEITLETLGGTLKITFDTANKGYSNVKLHGPAVQVFKGVWQ